MDVLYLHFPVSGVDTWAFIPPLIAFIISFFTSMSGVSGAFLLMPFQVSCLHFSAPSASATNFVYNIVAVPSGVYHYFKEGRMVWPLAWIIIMGTLPGIMIGYYLRVIYFPEPRSFRLFVSGVLLYLGARLLREVWASSWCDGVKMKSQPDKVIPGAAAIEKLETFAFKSPLSPEATVRVLSASLFRVEYMFCEERFSFSAPGMLALALLVGIIGGIYGIGGGAIIAPFCVTVFALPVYTVAGSTLIATFVTSFAGVCFYTFLPGASGQSFAPDWRLGLLFGVGGFAGLYCGARLQKFIPQQYLKLMLAVVVLLVAAGYVIEHITR